MLLTEERDDVVCFFLRDFFRLQLTVVNVDFQKVVACTNTTHNVIILTRE